MRTHEAARKARFARRWAKGVALLRGQPGLLLEIADELQLTKQAVSKWEMVPAHHARTVARLAQKPLYLFRPDIWPPPPSKKANGKLR